MPSEPGNHWTKLKTRAVKYFNRGVRLKTEATTVLAVTPNWSPPSQSATPKLWEPYMSPAEHNPACGEQWISSCFKELLLTGSEFIWIWIEILSLITINDHRKNHKTLDHQSTDHRTDFWRVETRFETEIAIDPWLNSSLELLCSVVIRNSGQFIAHYSKTVNLAFPLAKVVDYEQNESITFFITVEVPGTLN